MERWRTSRGIKIISWVFAIIGIAQVAVYRLSVPHTTPVLDMIPYIVGFTLLAIAAIGLTIAGAIKSLEDRMDRLELLWRPHEPSA